MHAFSVAFEILSSGEGERFRERCRREGKGLYTWTLNAQEQWAVATRWGVDVVMTDKPLDYMAVMKQALGTVFSFFLGCSSQPSSARRMSY